MHRVIIQWTATARDGLAKLPQKVRRGILDKANELRQAHDPALVHKPLIGPLAGYYRITYSRYRAIYKVHREKLTSGEVLVNIHILFVAVGIRKEGDKKDVYRLAQKLFELGLLDSTSGSKQEPESEE